MKKLTLVLFVSVLGFSGSMLKAFAWDGFSITETVDTENLSAYSTYPSPTNWDSMSTSTGVHYRTYGEVYKPATPPPLPFHKKLSASKDMGAHFFLMDYQAYQPTPTGEQSEEPTTAPGASNTAPPTSTDSKPPLGHTIDTTIPETPGEKLNSPR